MSAPVSVDFLELDWGGPIGDRHHGELMASDTRQSRVFPRGTTIRNHRQLSLVDLSELAQIATALGIPRIDPGVIADNICTEGIENLTDLPRMTRLAFPSGAVLMLGGPNAPCTIAGDMVARTYGSRVEAFPKAAIGRRGVTAWVERPGLVKPSDAITVLPPD
jgi:MOSC domain-containing protein YiiM